MKETAQKVISKPLHPDDEFIYKTIIREGKPVSIFIEGRLLKGVRITDVDPEKKEIYVNGLLRPIEIERISRIFLDRKTGEKIVNGYSSTIHFFDRFKGKDLFIDMYENLKLKQIRTKFLSMFKYQIVTQGKDNIGLMYKIHMSSFGFFKPYPEKLIEYTKDKESWKAGDWRKEFEMIREIFDEEMEEGKEYIVYLALKDGRNIKGITKKGFIFESLTRLFSTSRKESIFILNHTVADVLDIRPAVL